MLVKSVAAFAALTFAASVAAEPRPYKPTLMKTSVRDLFGVVRRQDGSGYQPEQAMCGEGATCAEACGAGYTTCSSGDNQVHCFNPTAGEICCPNKSGNSCDAGYYCTSDKEGETWCCPEGLDLTACAAAYSVTGGLVSQTPAPTSTSTSSSSSSTVPPTTTSTSTSSSTTSTSSTIASNSTTSVLSTSSAPLTTAITITSSPSLLPSSSLAPPSLNTTSLSTVVSPKPTQSNIAEGAGSVVGPASALLFLVAGVAALL